MKKKPTRYEINQEIKRRLVSHGTDLSQLNFSFSGKTAWFTGRLSKISGQEMTNNEVEALCKALAVVPDILFLNFELEDWIISTCSGAFTIARKAAASSAPLRDKTPLVIRSDDTIEAVLKEAGESVH